MAADGFDDADRILASWWGTRVACPQPTYVITGSSDKWPWHVPLGSRQAFPLGRGRLKDSTRLNDRHPRITWGNGVWGTCRGYDLDTAVQQPHPGPVSSRRMLNLLRCHRQGPSSCRVGATVPELVLDPFARERQYHLLLGLEAASLVCCRRHN
jgi:hypothetical protein